MNTLKWKIENFGREMVSEENIKCMNNQLKY